MRWMVLIVACVCGLSFAGVALAEGVEIDSTRVGTNMRLVLDSGDVVVGEVTGVSDQSITIESGVFGVVTVQRARVLTAVEVFPESTAEQLNDPVVKAVEEAAVVPEPVPPVVWENRFEAGLNGSEGNTEVLNFNSRLSFKRTTVIDTLQWDTTYRYSTDSGDETDNRLDSLLRYDRRFEEGSRWLLFGQGRYEYDEFQDWDQRVSLYGGLGYRLIENDTTQLTFRFGAGASREFGGGTDEWTPEGLLGLEFDHEISETQRIALYGTYLPSFDDLADFRTISGGAYEIDISEKGDLALRLGAEHRYDTQPGDAERSDLDYFARVVFKF